MPIDRATGEDAVPPDQQPDTSTAPGVPAAAVTVTAITVSTITALAVAVAGRIKDAVNNAAGSARDVDADARRIILAADAALVAALIGTIRAAYNRGAHAAITDLGRPMKLRPSDPVLALADRAVATLRATYPQVQRWARRAYRDTVNSPDPDATWNRSLNTGVTGFVDDRQRKWDWAAYNEMVTRTAVVNAATRGNLDVLHAAGHRLLIVSATPTVCALCKPWAGQILATGGEPGPRIVDGHKVAGTLPEAISAGLHHPWCRHIAIPFTANMATPTHVEDPAADERRSRLRDIARQVRRWELRSAAALTPEAKAKADQRVNAWRQALYANLTQR